MLNEDQEPEFDEKVNMDQPAASMERTLPREQMPELDHAALQNPAPSNPVYTKDQLEAKTIKLLKSLLKELGLPLYGSKAQLIERLLNAKTSRPVFFGPNEICAAICFSIRKRSSI